MFDLILCITAVRCTECMLLFLKIWWPFINKPSAAPPPPPGGYSNHHGYHSQKCTLPKTGDYCFPLLYICLPCDEAMLPWKFGNSGFDVWASQDPQIWIFSSAVPPGSGAFQMPTRPAAVASASTLRGERGRTNLRNFLFFGMKLLWDDINNIS